MPSTVTLLHALQEAIFLTPFALYALLVLSALKKMPHLVNNAHLNLSLPLQDPPLVKIVPPQLTPIQVLQSALLVPILLV